MFKTKRAIITGANGFVGSHLSLALARRGITVIGITRSLTKPYNHALFPAQLFVQIKGDIRNKKLLTKVFEKYKPQICFHLAAKSTVEEGQTDPYETYDVNVNGAINILELSRLYQLEKVVVASTSHVYGDNPNLPFKETHYIQPSRPYETSKTCVDLIAQSYADTYNMIIDIPRFVNLYGPGDKNIARIIPKLMKQIIVEGRVEIWCGDTIRDYLYIDDAIEAYVSLLKKKRTDDNKIINFGTGNVISIRRLVRKIIKISGKNIPFLPMKITTRLHEVKKQYVSIEKARKHIHWKPKVSLEEGLLRTFNWYQQYFMKHKF